MIISPRFGLKIPKIFELPPPSHTWIWDEKGHRFPQGHQDEKWGPNQIRGPIFDDEWFLEGGTLSVVGITLDPSSLSVWKWIWKFRVVCLEQNNSLWKDVASWFLILPTFFQREWKTHIIIWNGVGSEKNPWTNHEACHLFWISWIDSKPKVLQNEKAAAIDIRPRGSYTMEVHLKMPMSRNVDSKHARDFLFGIEMKFHVQDIWRYILLYRNDVSSIYSIYCDGL